MRPHPCTRICLIILAALVVAAPPAFSQSESTEGVYSEYMLGSYRLEDGDVVRAADHFERAWRMSQHDPEIGLKLGECYYLLKNFTRCELVIDDVLESRPEDTDALVMKAKVRYIQRDPDSAVAYLERVRDNGSTFEVERLLGNIYYEMGDPKRALEAYERCLAIDSTFPYIQYRYARLLAMDGQLAESEAAFRKAMALDPSFVEPELALIDLMLESGRAEEALPLLEDVVEKDPRNESAMITLGNLLFEQGKYDEAVALLERWQGHSPLSQEAQVLLGRIQFERGDFAAARGVFEQLLSANPGSAELARILGEVTLKAGDPGGARDYFDRAIASDPDDYRGYLALFFASSPRFARSNGSEYVVEMTDEAKEGLIEQASTRVPGSEFEANYLVGVSALSIDLLETAERHLLRAHELREDDYDTLFNLATVFEKQRQYERAVPYLESMVELHPDDATALNFYGYLLAEMRRELPRALEMVQRALELDPENGYFLDSLGWIYYQMEDYARAAIELEKASAIVNDDPVILEHLGDAYAAMRRFKEARSAYERSHQLQGDDGDDIMRKIESATREER